MNNSLMKDLELEDDNLNITNHENNLDENQDPPTNLTWTQSVRNIISNKNFTVFLLTNWVFASFGVINRYFNLFFRDIGISYVLIGVLASMVSLVSLTGFLFAGYLADNYDRRKMAIITIAINTIAYIILAFANDFWSVALGFTTFGLSNFTGAGGTAYIMEQIDKHYGGVAVSLFTLGSVLGLVPLFFFGHLLDGGMTFLQVMRLFLLIAGIAYFLCTIIRVFFLDPSPPLERTNYSANILSDLISETKRGIVLLAKVFPIFIVIICLDALSDSFYGFASLFYVNETLNFGIGEINFMLLLTLCISVPLTLYLGRVFDRRGGRNLTIAVYLVMPLAVSLLIVAQWVPYVVPIEWREFVDSVHPGLSVVFSLAFIATAIKSINDVLWLSVINTYIQKSLPRRDLGKMLALTTFFILLLATLGPTPAGIIYELYEGMPLLIIALVLNILILTILITKDIEPRLSAVELEEVVV
jgi:MFS family permease